MLSLSDLLICSRTGNKGMIDGEPGLRPGVKSRYPSSGVFHILGNRQQKAYEEQSDSNWLISLMAGIVEKPQREASEQERAGDDQRKRCRNVMGREGLLNTRVAAPERDQCALDEA